MEGLSKVVKSPFPTNAILKSSYVLPPHGEEQCCSSQNQNRKLQVFLDDGANCVLLKPPSCAGAYS